MEDGMRQLIRIGDARLVIKNYLEEALRLLVANQAVVLTNMDGETINSYLFVYKGNEVRVVCGGQYAGQLYVCGTRIVDDMPFGGMYYQFVEACVRQKAVQKAQEDAAAEALRLTELAKIRQAAVDVEYLLLAMRITLTGDHSKCTWCGHKNTGHLDVPLESPNEGFAAVICENCHQGYIVPLGKPPQ